MTENLIGLFEALKGSDKRISKSERKRVNLSEDLSTTEDNDPDNSTHHQTHSDKATSSSKEIQVDFLNDVIPSNTCLSDK